MASVVADPSVPASAKHPKGLYVLFTTEMWERFSYYGMRALLVLYLTKKIGMERTDALAIYAMYTSLVYLTPMFGGFIADQVLGQRKTIIIGGIVMAMGHFAMAFPPLLYVALGLLIVGNGFFKPNISTLVGGLYPAGDPRKDGAYTIFYMGINLGAFFSPIVCGFLGEQVSWHVGFAAAGVGMVFGLLTFWGFAKFIGPRGFPPGREVTEESTLNPTDWTHIIGVSAVSLVGVFAAIYSWPYLRPVVWAPSFAAGTMLLGFRGVILAAVIGGILMANKIFNPKKQGTVEAAPLTGEEWQRMAVVIVVTLFSVLFWMGFEQAGGTMTLFADEKTSRSIMGHEFPASLFQSINPMFIFILAPIFSIMWTRIESTKFKIPSIAKQGLGLILLGLGFIIMAGAESRADAVGKVAWFWLVAVYFVHTVAELCLSPIGLSLVNKLAPPRLASLMMAVFLMSSFIGNYLAGTLEAVLKDNKVFLAAHLPSVMITASGDVSLWTFLIVTSIGPGVLLLLVTPFLNKMSHGRA